jgi:hypothetical protein
MRASLREAVEVGNTEVSVRIPESLGLPLIRQKYRIAQLSVKSKDDVHLCPYFYWFTVE